MRHLRPAFFILVASFLLTGCLKDRFLNLPVFYRGVKTIGNDSLEISAVNYGLRRGEEFYRIRFQIFTGSLELKPEVIALRFKEDSDSTVWIDLESQGETGLKLKIGDSCASRENPVIRLCWSDQDMTLELPDREIYYKLQRDRGPLSAEITRPKDQPFSLKELMGRARIRNYKSAEEAVSVFQAKEKIAEARGNLLPHFNMRDILSVATEGPLGLIGSVGNLLPFIFPTNWNEWSKSRELYQAEILSFAALLANEMNSVEGFYYVIHRDQAMLRFLDQQIGQLETIQTSIKKLEDRGALQPGSTTDFKLSIRSIQQDRRQLSSLIEKELAVLAEAVALSPVYQKIDIASVELPNLTTTNQMEAREFVEEAKARSLELGTLYFMQEAARIETGQKQFGFLDPNSGEFFGAGYSHSIRIAGAEIEKLKIRTLGMVTGLERKSVEVAAELNEAIDIYRRADEGAVDVENRLDQVVWKPLERGAISLSDSRILVQIIDLYRRSIEFEASRLSSAHAYLIATSKLNRLLLNGFYEGLEVVSLPKRPSP